MDVEELSRARRQSEEQQEGVVQRVSIFVDGANMYYAQKKLGWYIDFRKVLHFFGRDAGHIISEAYYYTGADTQSKNRDVAFHEYLMYSGYTVRTKAIKQMVDDTTGEIVEKANLDIELVIDMFNTVTLFETCILMSGDGDFERALELVRSKGKRIAVVAHPEMTARELRNVAGRNYFDLRDLERSIARTDRLPDPGSPAGTYQEMEDEELEEPAGPPTHAQVNVWRSSTTISAQTTRPERY
jgi:uncharacterized LabA/DUF88 family protein